MDLEIYNLILKEVGFDPMETDTKKMRIYPNGERAFRNDIFKGKTIWTNDKWKDYLSFVASYHPLIGLFTSCKHHPYTKRKRFITLLMMLCVGSFWAALSANFEARKSHYWERNISKLIVSMCNGTILFVMELCLRYCLSCPCREDTENIFCNIICKCCTKTAISCWACIALSAVIAMFCLVIINDLFEIFIVIFTLQFVFSWILQCIGLYFKFKKGWKRDLQKMEKLQASDYDHNLWISSTEKSFKDILKHRKKVKFPYYITYIDYNNWLEQHPQYLAKKKKKNWGRISSVPLIGSMDNIMGSHKGSLNRDRDWIDLTDDATEMSAF